MTKAMFDATGVGNVHLLDAVPVVSGAVVSKPLINTPACKMIVFAMDAGQSISEHHAPYVASVHVLDGRLEFRVEGQDFELEQNDWLVMPSDARHDLVASQPTRFLLTLIK